MTDGNLALYRNPAGDLIDHGSYSAREVFRYCPRKFEYERVQGWWSKTNRSSGPFGKAVEQAVEFFEKCGRQPGAGVKHFAEVWDEMQLADPTFKSWVYTSSEGDYQSLARAGREMLLLYQIRAPFLPISINPKARFQVPTSKKIFPGTAFDIIKNKAYPDIISYPAWNHPMLPALASPVEIRQLIIDIKTAGYDYPGAMAALDAQLGEYAWQLNILDVAFLWFVKRSHDLEMGSDITLLQDVDGVWRAGNEVTVMGLEKHPETGTVEKIYASTGRGYDAFRAAVHNVRGNARDFLKEEIFAGIWDEIPVVICGPDAITKQRLQWHAARLTPENVADTGREIGQTTLEMAQAHKEGYYPKTPGTRFPNNKCITCHMRALCLNDAQMRDSTLIRKGEEWLAGLEE